MKIETKTVKVEASNEFDEKMFKIGDLGLVFDILRNKMYSNPIQSVAREITSNAYDAHTQANKASTPIEISLPNDNSSTLKIKDYGSGISPDDIENIYISYGTSTKRDSNDLIGAYGTGSKSIFSVTDTFNVVTVFNGVKYNYSCYIDETKVGACVLLAKSESQEPTGTEIIIPIKKSQFAETLNAIEFVTRHWKVKPKFTNGFINYVKIVRELEKKNWFIGRKTYSSNPTVKVLVGDIEYPLDTTALRSYADARILSSCTQDFYLKFNIGDLSLSASREQIYLDDATKKKIADRIEEVKKDLIDVYQAKIDACTNLYEANYLFPIMFPYMTDVSFLGNFKFKDKVLVNKSQYGTLKMPVKIYHFHKSAGYGNNPDKYYRRGGYSLAFEDNTKVYFNDLTIKVPVAKHVESAFKADPKLKGLIVVTPDDKYSKEVLDKAYNTNLMYSGNLSEITITKKTFGEKLNIFVLNSYGGVARSTYDVFMADKNTKHIGFKNKNTSILDGKPFDLVHLSNLVKNEKDLKTSFYFLNETKNKRIVEFANQFPTVESWIKSKVKVERPAIIKQKAIATFGTNYYSNITNLAIANNDICKKIKNIYQEIKNNTLNLTKSEIYFYEHLNSSITKEEINKWITDNKDLNPSLLEAEFYKTYPLLRNVSHYGLNSHNVIDYILLIDDALKAKKR